MIKKFKAAILNNNPETVKRVFSPQQMQELSEITDLMPGVKSSTEVELGKLSEVEVVFSTWGMPTLTSEQLTLLPKLQAVFYAAGATDYFARPCFERQIKVCSAWQANAIPVAEFCTAQIILALKGYFGCVRATRELKTFDHGAVGPGAYGETVALIGAGAISQKIQELLKNYNIKVIVVPSRREHRTISLEAAFRTAQVVSNHLPDRDDNVGVLNGELFKSMRHGATFINTGRGRQVREDDLLTTLKSRPDLTALLDVTFPEPPPAESELYTLPNVQLTPHIAGSLNDEVHRMSDYMIAEYRRFAAGEKLQYQVSEQMLLTSGK